MAEGFVAVGNGEPCPVCGKPFEKSVDVMEHLAKEHKEWLMNKMFPDEYNQV